MARGDAIRRIARAAAIFAALLVLFVAALTAVYALPQANVIAHAKDSLPLLRAEGVYHRPVLDDESYQLDNYTDGVMLDIAIANPGDSPLRAALAASHAAAGEKYGPIDGLAASVSGRRGVGGSYSYYWHGYQLFLRPALLFFAYPNIRYLNVMLMGLVLTATLLYLRQRVGILVAAAFAISLLAVGIYVVPLSLQFSSMVYLAILAVLVVVGLYGRGALASWDIEIFLVTGMLAAFFDLLTAPLLTLGLPLALVLALRSRSAETGGGPLRSMPLALGLSAAWAVGYVGAWVAKWLIASPILGIDVVRRALDQILFRTGMAKGGLQVVMALGQPLFDLIPLVRFATLSSPGGRFTAALFAGIGILGVAVGAWLLVVARRPRADIVRAASVLLVVPLPYVWFLVANNHTAIHHWFAYRIQAPVVFALIYFCASCIDLDRVRLRLRSRGAAPGGSS